VQLESLIRAIPDFPIPGILFRDITPLLSDPAGFRAMIDLFADRYRDAGIEYVVGIEARGYMLGAPIAYALGAVSSPSASPANCPARSSPKNMRWNTARIRSRSIPTPSRAARGCS